jgi:sortase (surface protein transpeptidase)
MASLTSQLELLKKEQAILAEKIKQEELFKRNQELTLERLQELNEKQKQAISNYQGNGVRSIASQKTNLITAPRFEVILEILKKQDERIKALENSN